MIDFPILKRDTSGLFGGDAFTKELLKPLGNIDEKSLQIENFPIKFGAVATDLRTGEEIWFTKGNVINAVRASCSIPGILTPVKDLERSTKEKHEWLIGMT